MNYIKKKHILITLVIVTIYYKNQHEINKEVRRLGTRLLSKKEYLNVDVNHLNQLTDDQFLERVEYDYTRKCLKNKDSLVIIEND
jgi:hypothetical protein